MPVLLHISNQNFLLEERIEMWAEKKKMCAVVVSNFAMCAYIDKSVLAVRVFVVVFQQIQFHRKVCLPMWLIDSQRPKNEQKKVINKFLMNSVNDFFHWYVSRLLSFVASFITSK